MEELLKCIKERIVTLKKAIAKAEKESGSFPEGRLRVSRSGKQVRYYKMLKQSDTIGEFIRKEKVFLAGQLAQRDFGLLDNEDYRGEALRKLNEYRCSGIFPGKNLLFSYETEDIPLDIKGVREMLNVIFR